MLFVISYQPGSDAETRLAAERWPSWRPPEGVRVRGHYTTSEGAGYVVAEAESVSPLLAGLRAWMPELPFKVAPVQALAAPSPERRAFPRMHGQRAL